MKISTIANVHLRGVYRIKNITTGKQYIGSTVMSFLKRLQHHHAMLKANKHKNTYLQRAWNKYGEDDFIFEVVEVCEKKDCLLKEQIYLDNETNLYNINPLASGTPNMSKETVKKRSVTIKKKAQKASEWYNKVKKGLVSIDNVPEEYRNRIQTWNAQVPWNKGKRYKSTDHLKVPKKTSDRRLFSENRRKQLPMIAIYHEDKLLLVFESAKDLEEWSLTEKNTLPINSRFSKFRMGHPVNYLKSTNINKACRTGKPYKGLIFKFVES